MKTQTKKLVFKTNSVAELNDSKLLEINGGTTPTVVMAFVASVGLSYQIADDMMNEPEPDPAPHQCTP